MKSNEEKMESRIKSYLAERDKEIIRMLTGIDEEIDITGFVLEKERLGNYFSKFWGGQYRFRRGGENSTVPEEEVKFYVEYLNGGRSDDEFNLKFRDMKLFEKSGLTPTPYRLEGLPRIILMSRKGEEMLEQRLRGKELDERRRLNLVTGDMLFRFHTYAERVWPEVVSEGGVVLESIQRRASTPEIEKSLRFFRACTQSSDCELLFRSLYEGTIAGVYDDHRIALVHGDAGAQNIVGPENKEKWETEDLELIDMEDLRLGHPMIDESKKTTSHNMLLSPEYWNEAIVNRMENEAKRVVSREQRWYRRKDPLLSEALREAKTVFYAAAIHEPFKRVGYMRELQRKHPERHNAWLADRPCLHDTDQEMRQNMFLAFDYQLKNPGEFLWERPQLDQLSSLRDLFEQEVFGNIDQRTIKFKNTTK